MTIMADQTDKKPIVEIMADQTHKGAIVEKPWGHELIWARTERYVGKILHINKEEALSRQYHNVKDETVRVLNGRMTMELGPDGSQNKVLMEPGDSLHIMPGMIHRMIAVDDCDVLEVSTPELEDVVRLDDRYGRVEKK